jgi:tetratricopeptide (TPR) repeat protein
MAVSTRHKWLNGLLAGTLCIVAVCVAQQASVVIAADWLSYSTINNMRKWALGESPYTTAQWEQARSDLLAAAALTPKDAILHDSLAELHALQGRALWTTGAPDSPEVALYQQALSHQMVSLQLRPTHGMAWASVALYQYAINSDAESLFKPWREAIRLSPREEDVLRTLLDMAPSVWSIAPEDIRRWIRDTDPKLAAKLESQPESR